MGDLVGLLVSKLARKILFGVLGLVILFGYLHLTGTGGHDDYVDTTRLPAVVFEGGGGLLEFEIDLNQAGQLHASFSRIDDEDASEEMVLNVDQDLKAGRQRLAVDVPKETYGYFEVSIQQPTPGAEIAWTVWLDGAEVGSEQIMLDEPLKSGYGFFVQLEFDDVANLSDVMYAD